MHNFTLFPSLLRQHFLVCFSFSCFVLIVLSPLVFLALYFLFMVFPAFLYPSDFHQYLIVSSALDCSHLCPLCPLVLMSSVLPRVAASLSCEVRESDNAHVLYFFAAILPLVLACFDTLIRWAVFPQEWFSSESFFFLKVIILFYFIVQ